MKDMNTQRYKEELERSQNPLEKKRQSKMEKFEVEKAHYLSVLDSYILETLEKAAEINGTTSLSQEEKDGALAQAVKDGDKKWKGLCSRVNVTNKIVKLSPASFRVRLQEVGNSVVDNKEEIEEEAVPYTAEETEEPKSNLSVVKDDEEK